jgi:hypothetical protein
MQPTATGDYARDFVEEVLRTGSMLLDLLDDLIESVPEDAFPGESMIEVVLDMLTETVSPAAKTAGEASVRGAVALLADCSSCALTDLERAAERARRRECRAGRVSWERRPG